MTGSERVLVRAGRWYDSAFLMQVSRRLGLLPGVLEAVVMMGTAPNRDLLAEAGFASPELAAATPMDMVVALRLADLSDLDRVEAELERLLAGRSPTAASGQPAPERLTSVAEAAAARPDAQVVSIAVPGPYAAFVAHRALDAGRHVFLFSNNVPVADEVELKARGREQGLLVMGPDCGTSILAGVGLGFSNRVPRGCVGIVGPSGTGIQEVSCLLAAQGQGVSHAIGTGSRDLSERVGGVMTELALRLLVEDQATAVLVLVAKSPHPAVAERVHALLAASGKPAVVRFLGRPPEARRDGVLYASTLDQAATAAAALARGEAGSVAETCEETDDRRPVSGRLVGLFSGGSLAAEARELLRRNGLASQAPDAPLAPPRPLPGASHLVADLGDDCYTRGRPHPMVDQSVRLELLAAAGEDRSVGVLLLDLVLGDGAHPDPAPEWVPVLEGIRRGRGASAPVVVVSLCGTAADPQGLEHQRSTLEAAGVRVCPSAARAAVLAAHLVGPGGPA